MNDLENMSKLASENFDAITAAIGTLKLDDPGLCWETVDVALSGDEYVGLMVRHVETKEFFTFLMSFQLLCRYLEGAFGVDTPQHKDGKMMMLSTRIIYAARIHNDIIQNIRAMTMGQAPSDARN